MNPSNLKCSEVVSLEYRKLCQALGVTLEQPVSRTFTQYPATDLLILNEMSDQELINVCSTNRYINNLCNNESFWLNRVLDRYGILGTGKEIKHKYIPDGTSWKEYYLWLSGLLRDRELATVIAHEHNRDDLKILLNILDVPNVPDTSIKVFDKPFFIHEDLRQFYREADFGSVDPTNPYGIPINNILLEVTDGISTPNNSRDLFIIYTKRHDLIRRNKIIPDALMNKWLKKSLDSIRSRYNKITSTTVPIRIPSFYRLRDIQPELDQNLGNKILAEKDFLGKILGYL